MTEEHTERYCLACEKGGHLTTECHATHGLNTRRARELFRLINLAGAERTRFRALIAKYGPRDFNDLGQILTEI